MGLNFNFLKDFNKERELARKSFSFLKNVTMAETTPQRVGRDFAVGVGRGVLRSGTSAGVDLGNLLLPKQYEQKQINVSNPIAQKVLGKEPIKSYKERFYGEGGVESHVKESRFRGQSGVVTPLLLAGLFASDILPGGGGKKAVGKELVEATTESAAKVALKKIPGMTDDVIERIAPSIAKTKDANVIKNLLEGGGSRIPKEVPVVVPPVTKASKASSLPSMVPPASTATSVEGSLKAAGQGSDIVEATVPKQRKFLNTVKTTETSVPEVQQGVEALQPQTYIPKANSALVERARNAVETNYEEAVKRVKSTASLTDEDTATGLELMSKAQREGRFDEAVDLADTLDKKLRESGRAVQAASIWGRLTPEGMLRFAQKEINKAGDELGAVDKIFGKQKPKLTPEIAEDITKRMQNIQKLPDGGAKDKAVKDVLEKISEQIPPGFSEKFDAYRYQNLLSSPRTQARNTVGNLFNAMVTRPATIATKGGTDWFRATLFGKERQAYLKEVPQYYRGLFNSAGDAIEAMKGAWKGKLPIGQPDLANIKALRAGQLPKKYTVVSRAMEAQDRFFQTLISSGEYAAQKAKGVSDDIARIEAEKVAKYSLFRNATDAKNATGQGALLSKIDQFTDTVNKIGQKHKSFRWFVPFVRTPMNISKQFIEYSPAGVATLYKASGARKDEQIAKALIGSTITALGAKAALDGQTTWAPPKNQKERDEFYGSGRKPYSIKIGGKWVPMISFGPFAYALALPAAVKDANDHASLDASAIDKLTDVVTNQAKFFSQQTYVQGVANFVDLLAGTGEGNLKSNLGQTASQAIPLSGLLRYISGIVDPIYRKQLSAIDSLKGGIPFLSKTLEARKDVFTDEPAKRNITDYTLPYTLGLPGKGKVQTQKEALLEFHRLKSKTSKTRTNASNKIKEAMRNGDIEKAKQLAIDYNKAYEASFKPYIKQYGKIKGEDLVKEYKRNKITSESLRRWYNNLKDEEEGKL